MWWRTWQESVPAIGATSVDQRQPGSKVPAYDGHRTGVGDHGVTVGGEGTTFTVGVEVADVQVGHKATSNRKRSVAGLQPAISAPWHRSWRAARIVASGLEPSG